MPLFMVRELAGKGATVREHTSTGVGMSAVHWWQQLLCFHMPRVWEFLVAFILCRPGCYVCTCTALKDAFSALPRLFYLKVVQDLALFFSIKHGYSLMPLKRLPRF